MDNTAVWQNDNLMRQADEQKEESAFCAEKTDKQLISLVLSGEQVSFEEIFDRYKLLVATIASRYFRRPEQIEEVIQISFTKVYFELKSFQFKPDFSFAGWVGRITSNVCLDILRSQKRKPEELICELSSEEVEFLLTDTPNEEKTAESLLVERDLAEKLMSCLEAKDQAILQMLYEEEMSVGEISKITGWSNSKIKVRAYRARNLLRKILKKFV
ncbi:MAG TPA: sigma-70 family RNA polymerase sigma factor [Pyrinomonadaceae bacterium]|jgi:RNA polymerase sigma-70 factor (ECF subfamily)|nr:sigma-70 family RNA polymerase sigma factor [Pyrinomonadaceae bacterium]